MKRSRWIFVFVVFLTLLAGYYRHQALRGSTTTRPSFTAAKAPTFQPIELPGGSHELGGRVVTESGVPAAGIEIFLIRPELEGTGAAPLAWGTTSNDGRFSFRGLRAAPYEAILYRMGSKPQAIAVDVPADRELVWTLAAPLERIESLPELVRADLAGKLVIPPSYSDVGDLSLAGYEVLLAPADDAHALSGAIARRTRTDADGNFVFERAAVAPHTLRLLPPWASGGSWPVLDAVRVEHSTLPTIHLLQLRTARVVGRVSEPDELGAHPIEGALVTFWPEDEPGHVWPPQQTDAAGGFTIFDLPPGPYRLRIRAGAAAHEELVDVLDGVTSRLALPPLDPRPRAREGEG